MEQTTLEWFGATTYRLRTKGVTMFLDTWLDRPSVMPKYLAVDDVAKADYILISHAHFDHLPGADRIAIKTGAIVIANCEAINVLRQAGVPEAQLFPVSGGERIPLFTREVRLQAQRQEVPLAQGPPGRPPYPHHSLAALSVHVWPSLHCFVPLPPPEFMDTGVVYDDEVPYASSLDITMGMQYALLKLQDIMPVEKMDDGMRSFCTYVNDREKNVLSHCDGGQLMFNIIIDGKALLWSAHLGGYEGIIKTVEPQPEIAILAIAGRANFNGRPFKGSAAQFALKKIQWLGQPKQVIWCLHDTSCVEPYHVDTTAATEMVERETSTKVLNLKQATPVVLNL
ncbi:uncharacterized protein BKA55DRAFT_698660 [Fusarium redolens]|uniref:Metallo-beta-lactamase domain-containing protein n=1 Tax=Fusarium redolens TaxID=48865 RepID=A0A9P9JP13_FUSRE|nr:uncharacterized protein BKA55DRAFT_698660 [Fusarium redolens]KAH7205128.1 hypothetical protein BKA55DRAFT_698660 [Fusarium redolens]